MTIPYDASREALFQPQLHPAGTVLGAATLPGVDGMVALAVEAARLAYVRTEDGGADLARLTADLAKQDFGAPTVFDDPHTDSQGFAALSADGLGVIAFRGTEEERLKDLLADIFFLKTGWPQVGGKVHAGFARSASALWPQVEAWLRQTEGKRQSLLVCGHSLGAAIATLLAVPSKASQLVTIGSPRVGDAAFATAFAGAAIPTTRIVDFKDVVTRVPPTFLPFDYQQVGLGVLIDRDGKLPHNPMPHEVDPDISLTGAALAGALLIAGGPLRRELSDHAPVNYLRAFWPEFEPTR